MITREANIEMICYINNTTISQIKMRHSYLGTIMAIIAGFDSFVQRTYLAMISGTCVKLDFNFSFKLVITKK